MTGWRFRQSPRRGAPVSPEFPAPPVGPLVSNQLISRAHIGAPVSSWKCAAIKQKPVAEATGEKWWWVYDSNVGRQSQRIYSPPQLATLVTHRKTSHMIAHPYLPKQALFCARHKKSQGSREDGSIRSECAHKRPRSFHPSPWRAKARNNTACAGWGGWLHA